MGEGACLGGRFKLWCGKGHGGIMAWRVDVGDTREWGEEGGITAILLLLFCPVVLQ